MASVLLRRVLRLVEFVHRSTVYRTTATNKGVAGQLKARPETSESEPWMQRELQLYFKSRKQLAEMVGADPDHFTDSDVAEALRYLLPSRLSAKDVRPSLKHPTKVFPERKEAAFDGDGRPLDPGFYTGAPAFHNVLYSIYLNSKVLGSVVGETPHSSPPSHWLKREVMSNLLAEELSELQYNEIIQRLSHLSSHPQSSTNQATQKTVLRYQSKSASQLTADSLKSTKVKCDGPVQTVGRRKSSTAVVRVCPGTGNININKMSFVEYFTRPEDRQQVMYPLLLTKSLDDYDIHISVHGGGLTGQSGAVRLAVSKALLALDKECLEDSGLLNRDPRSVERKKPGQKKARKKFTWVKR